MKITQKSILSIKLTSMFAFPCLHLHYSTMGKVHKECPKWGSRLGYHFV